MSIICVACVSISASHTSPSHTSSLPPPEALAWWFSQVQLHFSLFPVAVEEAEGGAMGGEVKVWAGDREIEEGSVEGEGSKGGAGGFETILPVTVARGGPEGDEG